MILLVCILLQIPSAAPASGATQNSTKIPATTSHVRELVQQLHDPAYSRRQAATTQLLRLPETAAPALREAQSSVTGTMAARLAELRAELQRRWFRQRLVKLADPRAASAENGVNDFPYATRLQELLADDSIDNSAEDSPEAAAEPEHAETGLLTPDPGNVLLQLLQAEPELFAASLYEPARVPELLEKRSSLMIDACDGREEVPFPTASALALMLVASQPEMRLLRSTSSNISRPLEDPRFNRLVATGRHRAVLRKVVSAWILRPGIAADRPLVFAIQHRLPAGRDVAVRVLQGAGRGPQLYYACMCLAALNSTADIPLLNAQLKSAQPAWTKLNEAGKKEVAQGDAASNAQVQLRDAALAALVHLQQIPPEHVGLKLVPSRQVLYRPDTVGALNDQVREQRLMQYKAALEP